MHNPALRSMIDTMRLLEHGVFLWPDGKSLMKHGNGYLLRMPACDICFAYFAEVERYLAFYDATFQHHVVDAEQAKQERVLRRLAQVKESE